MAIKKRPPVDPAAIEAFGAAADAPQAAPAPKAEPAPATPREVAQTRKAEQSEWPEGIAKTLLIRWPDANLAIELADVAKLEDRSQHKTALRALQRGLEVLRSEHGS